MDSSNGTQPEDWRSQFQSDSRERIVNRIMDTLTLEKIATRLEEKIYHAATSQSDYYRRIHLKMLRMEESSSNPYGAMSNAVPSSSTAVGINTEYPASLDATAQTSESHEEVYQKIKVMKDLYYSEIHEIHQKICLMKQQHESYPQHPKSNAMARLEYFKEKLERVIQCLQMSRSSAIHFHKDKLPSLEKQILGIINSHRPRKPDQTSQQEQLSVS